MTNLNPGEAAILLIRRSESDADKYFLAVRRSESGFDQMRNDFVFGPFQIPVAEFGEPDEFAAAFEKAVAAIRQFGPIPPATRD